MTRHISFELPYPPSTNRIWRNVNGRTVLSKVGKEYRRQVLHKLGEVSNGFGSVRLEQMIEVHEPDRSRRRDLDNLPKAVNDAMMLAGVFDDDSQIDALLILRRAPDRNHPRVVIHLKERT